MPRKKKIELMDEIINQYGGRANTYEIEGELKKRGYPPKSAVSVGTYLKCHGFAILGKKRVSRNNSITIWGPRSKYRGK